MRRGTMRGQTLFTMIAEDETRQEIERRVDVTQNVRAVHTVITVHELGQALVKMQSDGRFDGTFAMGGVIHFMCGQVNNSTSRHDYWEGTFEAREALSDRLVITGSFRVQNSGT